MRDGAHVLNIDGLRDLAPEVLDEEGHPRIMPASFYANARREERAWLALRHGLYCLPTRELCDWLQEFIAGRDAIEIGAGNGRIAQEIGIRATDSYLQDDASVRAYYEMTRQPVIHYGNNVEKIEGLAAVRKYKPAVVIGSWITHRYDSREHWRGGNMYGPDVSAILELCEHYVLIGNEQTHAKNPLWDQPHEIHYPTWLYSRALNNGRDFIAVWRGRT